MRLLDFNLSTADLLANLAIYWESPTGNQAIVDLLVIDHQLRLVPGEKHSLTLDQFRTRVSSLNPTISMFIEQPTEPVPLFGYRLAKQQLLLG